MAFKILLFAFSCFFLFGEIWAQETNCVCRLSTEFFADSLNSKSFKILVDVRPLTKKPGSWIEGARICPKKDQLMSLLDSLNKDVPLYFYCNMGELSQQAAGIACKNGFRYVYDLKGGFMAWRNNDMPVISKKEHKKSSGATK